MEVKDYGTNSIPTLVKSIGFDLCNIHMGAAKIKANIEINKLDGNEVKLTINRMNFLLYIRNLAFYITSKSD